MKAFIHGILYVVNTFYRRACYTQVLRDEDISFPPTTDSYKPEGHPVLKDLSLTQIRESIQQAAEADAEFEPYLSWILATLQATAYNLEPGYLDRVKAEQEAEKKARETRNKKKKGKKVAVDMPLPWVALDEAMDAALIKLKKVVLED